MSIRIAGQSDINPVDTPRAVAPKNVEAEGRTDSTNNASRSVAADQADVSTASHLVSLAKSAVPVSHVEKLSSLAARVAGGQYKPASGDVSRAIVNAIAKSK